RDRRMLPKERGISRHGNQGTNGNGKSSAEPGRKCVAHLMGWDREEIPEDQIRKPQHLAKAHEERQRRNCDQRSFDAVELKSLLVLGFGFGLRVSQGQSAASEMGQMSRVGLKINATAGTPLSPSDGSLAFGTGHRTLPNGAALLGNHLAGLTAKVRCKLGTIV